MKTTLALFTILGCLFFQAAAQIPDKETQIQAALLAAPVASRADCTVLGYDQSGKLITLKVGSNNFICLGDNPNKPGFNVACYHKALEEFMARGRALAAQGKNPKEIFDIREEEAKSGVLKMPKNPSMLYVFSGSTQKEAVYRSVVYIPFATAESTGLPTSPMMPGGPWIMDPGTHRAHIMLTPTH